MSIHVKSVNTPARLRWTEEVALLSHILTRPEFCPRCTRQHPEDEDRDCPGIPWTEVGFGGCGG